MDGIIINANSVIPKHEIEALALSLLPDIQAYFESEDGQRAFEEWTEQKEIDNEGNL